MRAMAASRAPISAKAAEGAAPRFARRAIAHWATTSPIAAQSTSSASVRMGERASIAEATSEWSFANATAR